MHIIKKTDLSSRKSDQVKPKSKVFFEMKVFQKFKKKPLHAIAKNSQPHR